MCISEDLVFDKPFLIMIQKEGGQKPYFALWVANAELLLPYQGEPADREWWEVE